MVGAVTAVAAWTQRDAIRLKIASVYAPAAPKPQPGSRVGPGTAAGLHGDAPWALSALPECATQLSRTTGPLPYVAAHVPAGLAPVAPPATLEAGNCTIELSGRAAFVRRGADRLRIPPDVTLYRGVGKIAILRQDPRSGNDLRVYELRPAIP